MDVVGGLLLLRIVKDLIGIAELDQLAQKEKAVLSLTRAA